MLAVPPIRTLTFLGAIVFPVATRTASELCFKQDIAALGLFRQQPPGP